MSATVAPARNDELVRAVEARFLPSLRAAAHAIATRYPSVRATAWSHPHGESACQVIAVSCYFPNAPLNQPDQVTLQLCLSGLKGGAPSIDVDVIWGYPGQIEADLFSG